MKYPLGLLALIAGLAVGDWFPDLDQKTSVLWEEFEKDSSVWDLI